MQLKYGMNPHQKYAAVEALQSSPMPVSVLNGTPSLINFLDALNGWQLVSELKASLGLTAAASFKHVSPAGVGLAVPLEDRLRAIYEVTGDLTPAALAYIRARGADPKSSFGDFVALSDVVDEPTAEFLKGVVSDGIIAPGYQPAALGRLKSKKSGGFILLAVDPAFEPPEREARELFGVRLVQDRDAHRVTEQDLANVVCGALDASARRDLVLGLTTLKYTQSNSVGYAWGGQMVGIGAGQQSRVDCTKLAGAKADVFHLQYHPKALGLRFQPSVKRQERINFRIRYLEGDLTAHERVALDEALASPAQALTDEERREHLSTVRGVSLVSDGFIPFRDNIDQASKHGVRYVAEPGGSARDQEVVEACREYGMTLVFTGLRLFHH
jgi:phosphoribosylaminoimidazolecarboxamide formyltransferase/IMP cyclohydrolase